LTQNRKFIGDYRSLGCQLWLRTQVNNAPSDWTWLAVDLLDSMLYHENGLLRIDVANRKFTSTRKLPKQIQQNRLKIAGMGSQLMSREPLGMMGITPRAGSGLSNSYPMSRSQ
jgi:hypothetical protein